MTGRASRWARSGGMRSAPPSRGRSSSCSSSAAIRSARRCARRKSIRPCGHNKRVIPVIVDDTPEAAIREFVPDLTAINWIIFRRDDVFRSSRAMDERPASPKSRLWHWPRSPSSARPWRSSTPPSTPTGPGSRPRRDWRRGPRNGSATIARQPAAARQGPGRGGGLARPGERSNDPQPTDLQRQYVLAGRRAESRRQRVTLVASLGATGVVSIFLVIAVVLGLFAWQAQQTAQNEANARATEVVARATAEAQALSAKSTAEAEAIARGTAETQPYRRKPRLRPTLRTPNVCGWPRRPEACFPNRTGTSRRRLF